VASWLGKSLLDGRGQDRIIRRHIRRETVDDLAVTANQELFEIPRNITGCAGARPLLAIRS
jgi:hypothetical protein